jgi:transcription initiation factor TFIID TATA-box-binding protein
MAVSDLELTHVGIDPTHRNDPNTTRLRCDRRQAFFKYLFIYYINNPLTKIRIENVVASTTLSAELDLPAIAVRLDGAEYDPDQFPGVIYRLREPKTAILLFHSGKAVCTGGKSWKQVDESIRQVVAQIHRGGQKVLQHPKIQVQNIVATSDLGSEIDLTPVAITLGLDRVEYEPEQFPGLVLRLEEPRVVVLLFSSGKMVCTGARRPSDIAVAVQKVTWELRVGGLLRPERGPAVSEPTVSPLIPQQHSVVPTTPAREPARPSDALAVPMAYAGPSSTRIDREDSRIRWSRASVSQFR